MSEYNLKLKGNIATQRLQCIHCDETIYEDNDKSTDEKLYVFEGEEPVVIKGVECPKCGCNTFYPTVFIKIEVE